MGLHLAQKHATKSKQQRQAATAQDRVAVRPYKRSKSEPLCRSSATACMSLDFVCSAHSIAASGQLATQFMNQKAGACPGGDTLLVSRISVAKGRNKGNSLHPIQVSHSLHTLATSNATCTIAMGKLSALQKCNSRQQLRENCQ